MISYWEKKSFLHYDIIIIGAGITGLSTALAIKDLAPGYKVAVLERGILPAGASLRNAGFACIGSLTEMLGDLEELGKDKLLELVRMRISGLALLRRRLGDRRIGYRDSGSFELLPGSEPFREKVAMMNRLLFPEAGKMVFSEVNDRVKAFGFDPAFVGGMIRNHLEGELDSGMMMKALVAVCTNAFTRDLLPGVPIRPGRGQVLLTAPVAGLPFRGIFHFDKGFYYFRELAGRVLLGGGRNLDFSGETTTVPEVSEMIQQDLEEKLRRFILPGRDVRIDRRWAGIMGFGPDRFPLVKAYSPRISLGAGMGGMGIAIGSDVGLRVAKMIMG